MKSKTGTYTIVLVVAAVLLTAMMTSAGCKKKEPVPTTPKSTLPAPAATIEQTTCPVMAGPINKDIFTEYKGQKVYFCCAACKEKFEAAPEQYISKLPQFKQ